jgi:ABC-2 type transport system ATP-binding protein
MSIETDEPVTGLAELPGVHEVTIDGTRARFEVEPGRLNEVLRHVTRFGVRELTSAPPTLEELFMRHYGAEGVPRAAAGTGAR